MFVHKKNNSNYKIASFFSLSISLFGFGLKDDETPEDKLTNTIKRAIMSINNQQYEKAEQILHLALRMAQDLQSRDGITYVYDVMANLALEREQYEKAEKLFSEVMKRLLEEGYQEDNLKVIHISLKLANIAHHLGKVEKSMLGFNWTLPKIEKRAESNPDDVEIKEIFGLAKYWFGQLLIKTNEYEKARLQLISAYECFIEIYGFKNTESITILNDLSVACAKLNRLSEAKSYILTAIRLAKVSDDYQQEAILQINLGLILLQEGLLNDAKLHCSQAWRLSKETKDYSAVRQAEICLNQIKIHEVKLEK